MVLTRRGRLALTGLVLLTAVAMVLAVQSLTGGSATVDPLATSADGSTGERAALGAGEQAGASMDSPLIAPTTPAAAPVPIDPVPTDAVAQPASPTPAAAAPTPVIVNGRQQPIPVEVPSAASGELVPVPGSTEAVSGARVWTYRVEVERGLPFDGAEFAGAVHTTLADPRGWAQDGNAFRRVEGDDVDFRLVLASPELTDRLCAPLQTRGRVSCRNGDLVVLNALRWAEGIEDYAGDVASYREYLVNHEVGHRLGRSHVECSGSGEPAPVMMQQTYGLEGCAPNSWPLPGE